MSLVKCVYGQTSENLYSVRTHVARRRMSNSLALFDSATKEEQKPMCFKLGSDLKEKTSLPIFQSLTLQDGRKGLNINRKYRY